MNRHASLSVAAGLALALVSAAILAQAPRGLDFSSYLSLKRGMTEGEVLAIAGAPDAQAEEGAVALGRGRTALRVRTYTYLPTGADPHTTTITLVGGRATEIRRDRKF